MEPDAPGFAAVAVDACGELVDAYDDADLAAQVLVLEGDLVAALEVGAAGLARRGLGLLGARGAWAGVDDLGLLGWLDGRVGHAAALAAAARVDERDLGVVQRGDAHAHELAAARIDAAHQLPVMQQLAHRHDAARVGQHALEQAGELVQLQAAGALQRRGDLRAIDHGGGVQW